MKSSKILCNLEAFKVKMGDMEGQRKFTHNLPLLGGARQIKETAKIALFTK
jgi:hypothetical protein